jgi:hypothetical protein
MSTFLPDLTEWAQSGFAPTHRVAALRNNGFRSGYPSRLADAELLSARRNAFLLRDKERRSVIKLFNSENPVALEESIRELFLGAQFHSELLAANVVCVRDFWTMPQQLPPHVVLSPLADISRDWTLPVRQPQAGKMRRGALVERDVPPTDDVDSAYTQMVQAAPSLAFIASEQQYVEGNTLLRVMINADLRHLMMPSLHKLTRQLVALQTVSFQHGDLSPENVIVATNAAGGIETVLIDCARASLLSTGITAVPTKLFIASFDMRMLGIWLALNLIEGRAPGWTSADGRALRSLAAALVVPPVALVDLVASGGARTQCSNNYAFVSAADHTLYVYVDRMVAVADHLLNSDVADPPGSTISETARQLMMDYGPWMRTLAEEHPAILTDINDLAMPMLTQRLDVLAA